jgi:hypothetical protein
MRLRLPVGNFYILPPALLRCRPFRLLVGGIAILRDLRESSSDFHREARPI